MQANPNMNNLKNKIKNIPSLGKIILKAYRIFYPEIKLDYLIQKYLTKRSATIVQIGSNDGKTGDPIFHALQKNKKWKAILVEPVPYLFERLKNNYSEDARFIFENVAINDGSEQTFYAIKPEVKNLLQDLPPWFDQLGSFLKSNITKHLNGRLEPYIQEIKLQGVTLNDLFLKHSLTDIELLHIDTEGYDWKILSQLNLKTYQPSLILYEQKHLTEKEKQQSVEFLCKDYFIFDFGGDFLAIHMGLLKKRDYSQLKNRSVTSSAIQKSKV